MICLVMFIGADILFSRDEKEEVAKEKSRHFSKVPSVTSCLVFHTKITSLKNLNLRGIPHGACLSPFGLL